MTQQIFQKEIDEFMLSFNKALQEIKKAMKTPGYVVSKDNIYTYFKLCSYTEQLYNGIGTSELKETIKQFEADTKKHKNKLNFSSGINITVIGDENYGSIDTFELKATWYELYEENSPTIQVKAKLNAKEKLKSAILDHAGLKNKYFNLDCKLVSLWLDNKIDFDTIASISTANCKL